MFVGTTASYSEIIHKLGGAAVNGFYSTCTVNNPYADDPVAEGARMVRRLQGASTTRTRRCSRSTAGRSSTCSRIAANAAGKDLNPDTLNKAIESTKFPADMFGADENTFSPTKHLGTDRAMLCQIQDGKWKSVSEYLTN